MASSKSILKKEAEYLKKKAEEERAIAKKEICDNCSIGTWNTIQWNLDLNGKPLTKRCPYYMDGKYGLLRGTAACDKFKA